MTDFCKLLGDFDPISLEEMNGVRLMNRTDTKYLTYRDKLLELLHFARPDYRIQEVGGIRDIPYKTVYLDTLGREMYLAHQNGKRVREKIRLRSYVGSGLTFLEVKNKNNKGRTDKKRIRLSGWEKLAEEGGEEFLRQHAWYRLSELIPQMENQFCRVTLVDGAMSERLTIDHDVRFLNLHSGKEADLENLVIIELKRDGHAPSPICRLLHELHIQPAGMSKYCIGSVLTDRSLKYNRFKPRLRTLERICCKQFI